MAGELEIVYTLVAAAVMAALGYLKRAGDEGFQPEKLVSTFVSAIIIGVLFAVAGVSVDLGEELVEFFLIRSGGIVVVERILKAAWRKWIGPWYDNL